MTLTWLPPITNVWVVPNAAAGGCVGAADTGAADVGDSDGDAVNVSVVGCGAVLDDNAVPPDDDAGAAAGAADEHAANPSATKTNGTNSSGDLTAQESTEHAA